MSRNHVDEEIGGAHQNGDSTEMVGCDSCIVTKKCCGQFFADGACCGGGEPIIVKCPPHAIVEAVAAGLTRSMPTEAELESEAA